MSDKKYAVLTVILIALTAIVGLSYLFLKTSPFSSETPQTIDEVEQVVETECSDTTVYDYDTIGDAYPIPEKVCNINFSKRGLTTISEDVFLFPNLEILRLDYNEFQDLPAEIGKLTKLKELYLNNNHFSQIPQIIFNLNRLERLDISTNKISEIPPEIQNLRNLKVLKVVNNQVSNFPMEMGNLTSLETLDASFNKISELPDSFSNLDSMDTIFLEQNNFTTVPQALTGMDKLTGVTLNENSIDPGAIDSLRQTLPQVGIQF